MGIMSLFTTPAVMASSALGVASQVAIVPAAVTVLGVITKVIIVPAVISTVSDKAKNGFLDEIVTNCSKASGVDFNAIRDNLFATEDDAKTTEGGEK